MNANLVKLEMLQECESQRKEEEEDSNAESISNENGTIE